MFFVMLFTFSLTSQASPFVLKKNLSDASTRYPTREMCEKHGECVDIQGIDLRYDEYKNGVFVENQTKKAEVLAERAQEKAIMDDRKSSEQKKQTALSTGIDNAKNLVELKKVLKEAFGVE